MSRARPSLVDVVNKARARLDEATQKANAIDARLRATDKPLRGSVMVMHRDGSLFFFEHAFVLLWKPDKHRPGLALVLTEHHGPHVYDLEDLTEWRAYGPRVAIRTVT